MKTILVATDFSEASHNASLYGIELARAFNARLILFSSYQQVPVPVTETTVIITLEKMRNLTQQQLEDKARIINAGNFVNVETYCQEGQAGEEISKAAKDKKADIIITGMKKSEKGLRKFFGSTVTVLARRATVPLIVIPENAIYVNPSTIALANESDVEPGTDIHLLDALREIGERFDSKLYLVRVAKDRLAEAFEVLNSPYRLNKMVRTLSPHNKYLHGKDIPQVLNAFISDHNVNILALLPHKHSLLERLFFKSTTNSMVFETHIPLLILPDPQQRKKENKRINKEIVL